MSQNLRYLCRYSMYSFMKKNLFSLGILYSEEMAHIPYLRFSWFLFWIWTLKHINFGIELISKSTTSSSFNGQDTFIKTCQWRQNWGCNFFWLLGYTCVTNFFVGYFKFLDKPWGLGQSSYQNQLSLSSLLSSIRQVLYCRHRTSFVLME